MKFFIKAYGYIVLFSISMFFSTSLLAENNQTNQVNNGVEELKKALSTLMPGTMASSIEATTIPGLFEVSYGPTVFYFNKDATLMLKGDLVDLRTRENLTETKRSSARVQLIEAMGEDNMVVFPAANEKYKVSIFTDIDCPYCTKLHKEMPAYNAAGITVRYMAYPRAGIDSSSYKKVVSVWCSPDKKQAMTDAKNGLAVKSPSCDNPVAKQFELGQVLGVRGTPAIFMHDGNLIPGYVPAQKLKEMLDKNFN